jgi:hypothetical protein
MIERPVEEEVVHQEIITLLKKAMYNYPNATHPSLITFINHPLKNKTVIDPDGNELYPDIVIINSFTNKIVMIGEVETASSINDLEVEQWRQFTRLSTTVYIFYPKGLYAKMSDLCKKVPLNGFFEYHKEDNHYVIARKWPC